MTRVKSCSCKMSVGSVVVFGSESRDEVARLFVSLSVREEITEGAEIPLRVSFLDLRFCCSWWRPSVSSDNTHLRCDEKVSA